MKTRYPVTGLIVVMATIAICSPLHSNDAPNTQPSSTPPATSSLPVDQVDLTPEQAMMMQCMQNGAPGPEHAQLAKKAGSWEHRCKIWTAPDTPPTEASGTTELKMILGGRFLVDHSEGTFMGQPFEGMGITGYDNVKKKYVTIWIDGMSTGMMVAEGVGDEGGQEITFNGEYSCPMTGTIKRSKSIERMIDEDNWTMQMYDTTPEGDEWKTFEITYTRKK